MTALNVRLWLPLAAVLQVLVALPAWTQDNIQFIPHGKPRLIVLTDLSNEPDDEESLVRLLVYSDQFELEGLIATTSTWLRHNPRLVLNGNRSTDVVMIPAKAGATVKLSAQGTDAGDEAQTVKINWWIYREAGTLAGATLTHTNRLDTEVVLSAARRAGSVHVILQAEDDGTPRLFAYRRVIIQVTP